MEGGNSPNRAYVEKYADAVFASFTEAPFLTQLWVAKIIQIGLFLTQQFLGCTYFMRWPICMNSYDLTRKI